MGFDRCCQPHPSGTPGGHPPPPPATPGAAPARQHGARSGSGHPAPRRAAAAAARRCKMRVLSRRRRHYLRVRLVTTRPRISSSLTSSASLAWQGRGRGAGGAAVTGSRHPRCPHARPRPSGASPVASRPPRRPGAHLQLRPDAVHEALEEVLGRGVHHLGLDRARLRRPAVGPGRGVAECRDTLCAWQPRGRGDGRRAARTLACRKKNRTVAGGGGPAPGLT